MALGPGKYDDECTKVREAIGADGVLLVVVSGSKGSGFACQADYATTLALPDILEHIAQQIRQDGKRQP